MTERRRLIGRLEQEREQLAVLRGVTEGLEARVEHDERMLSEIETVLGRDPQLRLDQVDIRVRGRQLEALAISVLAEAGPADEPIHYKAWFELLRTRGHLVAGKVPVDTFLAQINRSEAVERVGRRTGLYRLRDVA